MKRFNFALLVLILCSGCASTLHVKSGNQALTGENVQKIQKGMTKDEVSKILGKPISMSEAPPLGEFWTYSYSEVNQTYPGNPFANRTPSGFARSLTVTFDVEGKVKNLSKSENNLFQPVTVSFT